MDNRIIFNVYEKSLVFLSGLKSKAKLFYKEKNKLSLKKGLIYFLSFTFCFAAIWAIKVKIDKGADSKLRKKAYSIPREVQYHFTLKNKTNRLIKKAEFWTYAPVKQTSTQLCDHIKSSHPYKLITDDLGNQVLHFTVNDFPPYANKIIQIKARVLLSDKPVPTTVNDLKPYLKTEKYIESDDPGLSNAAKKLDASSNLKTAENIFQWVAGNVQYAGYIKKNRGALYALSHKKGDCTEFMYLFTALCRAVKIPARCMGGYIAKENSILKPGYYHNWAQFYEDGAWRISDPQNKVFMQENSNYIAMRIIEPNSDNQMLGFNRFRVQGEGLEAKMN